MFAAIEKNGYCPRTTPVDTLADGPVQMHLDAGCWDGRDLWSPEGYQKLPGGFQEWDPEREALENAEAALGLD